MKVRLRCLEIHNTVLPNLQCPLPLDVQMLFSDDESENSNVESDSKIPSVELAKARRELQEKEKQLKKMRNEIMALYRINRRLNLKDDRLKGRGKYMKDPLKTSKGKKVKDQSDSEDIESGDSELEFNPKPVKKPKKTKSNAGKQFITSMNSNVHSEQSNSEDYNSETEQSDIGECISLSEQICESSHPLVQEDDLEDNAANSKYKFFVL